MSTLEESLTRTREAGPAISARGPLSALLLEMLAAPPSSNASCHNLDQTVREAIADSGDIAHDDDLQLALFILYSLHYGGLQGLDDAWEWNPVLVATRLE